MAALTLGSGAQLNCTNLSGSSGSQKPWLERRQYDSLGLVVDVWASKLRIHNSNSRIAIFLIFLYNINHLRTVPLERSQAERSSTSTTADLQSNSSRFVLQSLQSFQSRKGNFSTSQECQANLLRLWDHQTLPLSYVSPAQRERGTVCCLLLVFCSQTTCVVPSLHSMCHLFSNRVERPRERARSGLL